MSVHVTYVLTLTNAPSGRFKTNRRSADSQLVASGSIVHLALPLAPLACYRSSGVDSHDEEGNHEAQSQRHKLIEDCQKCVHVGSLHEAQRVSDRIRVLAQQKVVMSVSLCLRVLERARARARARERAR